MTPVFRDDNLRLIFSTQERDFIYEKYAYHKTNFITCGGILVGFFFFLELYPLLNILHTNSDGLLMLIGFAWTILALCAFPIGIIAVQKLQKYKRFLQEHQKFMRKYRRSEE